MFYEAPEKTLITMWLIQIDLKLSDQKARLKNNKAQPMRKVVGQNNNFIIGYLFTFQSELSG